MPPPLRVRRAPRRPWIREPSASSARKPRSCLCVLLASALCVFALTLAFEARMLPASPRLLSLPGARGLPAGLPAAGGGGGGLFGSLGSLGGGDSAVPPKPATLRSVRLPANISVVMPCFGHVAYIEEALASVVHQSYPPAEVIVVDDGSEDRCGDAAMRVLSSTLAAPRLRQAAQLRAWWGWGAEELGRFRDEVVLTPNRGVAHARNSGIRRARGDWIVCLDADDMISEAYFMQAMEHVARSPETNLVYANQQFFGESKWQWNVPELRVDTALVNGPLPLMTLWRRSLWFQTPYGFDEALPKGHEDWAYWLQLTRLQLRWHKLNDFLTQYRYKKSSKMRNREKNNPEVPRLLRTLFPDLYTVRKLLLDHHELLKPNGFSESVRMDVSVSQHLHPQRATVHLWRGMILQAKGDHRAAVEAYNTSRALAQVYDWQPAFRLWRALEGRRDAGAREARMADDARDELRRQWGAEQFEWYRKDAFGV